MRRMTDDGREFNALLYEGEYKTSSTVLPAPWASVTYTIWWPENTWWNWLKWLFGRGEKPTIVTRSFRTVLEPTLTFDRLPKGD